MANMINEMLFNKTNLSMLSKSLDSAMLRNRAIANNIANATTPGYRRVEVSFEDELRGALDRTRLKGSRTDSRHIPLGRLDIENVNAKAYHPVDPTLASGVNNVDIDTEMAKLAENQIAFNYVVKYTQGIFKKMNSAIQGRALQ
ncbi:MAG: flagellar basal body rod protein FlgB [Fibrobacter sp.]|nr:flagellar basal body rod protein FlgB [Fibrobacter sp.]